MSANKNQPLLTIGMSAYGDFPGVYMTIQALKLYHMEFLRHTQLVVVDNDPDPRDGTDSKAIKNFVEHMSDTTFGGGRKYIALENIKGTTVPRQLVFDNADGQFVMVIDSHVMLLQNALRELFTYIYQHPQSDDILCGPLHNDRLFLLGTHFNYIWRAEMWGRWGQAYHCPDCQRLFSCNDEPPGEKVTYLDLMEQISNSPSNAVPIVGCQGCGHIFPIELPWPGHEGTLVKMGYIPAGGQKDKPFEIPAMGLGLFCCRKEAWHGWGYDHRGFGGEECCIHDIHRKEMGGKTICIPQLRWIHRFAHTRPKYPLNTWNKVRNYILWFKRLGYPLDAIREEFINRAKKIEPHAFNFIAEDPVRRIWPDPVRAPKGQASVPAPSTSLTYQKQLDEALREQHVSMEIQEGCGGCGKSYHVQPDMETEWNMDSLYQWLLGVKRDLDEHMPTIQEYADRCDHVTDLGHRRESVAALVCSKAQHVTIYNPESADPVVKKLLELIPRNKAVEIQPKKVSEAVHTVTEDIDDTDLLFVDTLMTFDRITRVLERFAPKVRKYIIIHDTKLFMQKGEDGGPGIMFAVRSWLRNDPQWFPVYLTDNQYGLAVYSRVPEDRPKMPHLAKKVFNFAIHAAGHVKEGAPAAPDHIMEARLNICANCTLRNLENCSACGCPLPKKTSWADQFCDHGKWNQYKNEQATGLPSQ